jgi:hypothetical protein
VGIYVHVVHLPGIMTNLVTDDNIPEFPIPAYLSYMLENYCDVDANFGLIHEDQMKMNC